MAGKLQFVVEVTSDQASKGFQAVTHALEEVGVQSKIQLGKMGEGARGASGHMDGLSGAFMRFKREQVQQGRMVGFYVRELTEFTGMGKEAQGIVSGLGQVLVEGAAGGLSFGLAFEAIKFTIGVVAEEIKRAGEETKLLTEAQASANGVWQTGMEIVREKTRIETAGAKAAREAAQKFLPELQKVQESYDKLRESGPGVWAWVKTGFGDSSGLDAWNAKLARIADEIDRSVRNARAMKELVGSLEAGYGDAGTRVVSPEEQKRANEAAYRVGEEERKKREERAKAAREYAAGTGRAYGESEAANMLFNAQSDMSGKNVVPYSDRDALDKLQGQQMADSETANMLFNAKNTSDADAFKRKLEEMNAAGAAVSDTFSSMGVVIGKAFGKAAGDMTAWFGKLIQQAVQLAVAMSATAGPLGWLNTAAAAAAIMATLASIPEMRAMGGSVSAGKPYIVGELGPELFVPNSSGAIVPNNKMGGNTTIVVNATDPKSFEDYLERNADRVIARLNAWSRDRRI